MGNSAPQIRIPRPRFETVKNQDYRGAIVNDVWALPVAPIQNKIILALVDAGPAGIPAEVLAYASIETQEHQSFRKVLDTWAICIKYSILGGYFIPPSPLMVCSKSSLNETQGQHGNQLQVESQNQVSAGNQQGGVVLGVNPHYLQNRNAGLVNPYNLDAEMLIPNKVYFYASHQTGNQKIYFHYPKPVDINNPLIRATRIELSPNVWQTRILPPRQ